MCLGAQQCTDPRAAWPRSYYLREEGYYCVFLEPELLPRNTETVGSGSRDAKTVTMAHKLDRSFALSCPGSSSSSVSF